MCIRDRQTLDETDTQQETTQQPLEGILEYVYVDEACLLYTSEKQVKHITEPHEEQPKEAKAAVNLKPEPMVQETVAIDMSQIQEADLEKNVDELLLTQSLNEELRQNQNEPEDDLSLTKSLGDLWTKKPGSGE